MYNTILNLSFVSDRQSDPVCDIAIQEPGAYEYYVEYTHWESTLPQVKSANTGYIVVDPCLYLPNDSVLDSSITKVSSTNSTLLPLDGIVILSVIPKWMPVISGWPAYFNEFSEAGYNMVHFAPLNERGISNSPYSIYDQLSLSNDLFDHPDLSESMKDELMKKTIDTIYHKNKILSITDIVWNHTACNSSWLLEHPEAGYNLKTAPHLRPAYELDDAILLFSEELTTVHGKSATVTNDSELSDIVSLFSSKILPALNLWQFYVVDSIETCKEFRSAWTCAMAGELSQLPFDAHLYESVDFTNLSPHDIAAMFAKDVTLGFKMHQRFSKKVNISVAMSFIYKLTADLQIVEIDEQIDQFEKLIDELNMPFYLEYDNDLTCIKEQILNRANYLRIAEHGPRLGPITRHLPIVDTYFTRLPVNHITKERHPDELCLASNGWIWNADPLVNFASEDSKAYLRREVISWGDCVKLRYGNEPKDNAWLWEHQTMYTRKMAHLFHGLRIDNCHSTPIHVAQYLLDVARAVNPNLYVFAELFTGSEEKDILFVSKLGINSLIREAMNAWDPQELSRVVHRQGGTPIGSFTIPVDYLPLGMLGHNMNSDCYDSYGEESKVVMELHGSKPHIMLMDCTHDNETPHQKRTAEDSLPNAALVAMANCAIGSVKGYDEIVPDLLNVVTETRKYRLPDSFEGIYPAKSIINTLHTKMAREGYSEIHVNQEADFISVHRIHPVTHDGYLLIARCAFRGHATKSGPVHSPIILHNQMVHVVESATLSVMTGGHNGHAFSPYMHDTSVEYDQEEFLAPTTPTTPTQLYHSFDGDAFDDLPPMPRAGLDRKPSRKVVGCISGLPSTLEFSTVLSQITHSFVEDIGEADDIQTVISIDSEHFIPGSIVVYRTWVVGTGTEQDIVSIPSKNHGDAGANDTVPSGITTNTDTASSEPGLSVVTLDIANIAISSHSKPSGAFEQLWLLLGMDSGNTAVELMMRFGNGIPGSNRLWFTSQSSNWPPGLYDAIQEMSMGDLNMALFRAGPEEVDTIGDSTYNVPGHGSLAYCGLQGIISALMHTVRNNDLGASFVQHLRQGHWLSDYTLNRLDKLAKRHPGLIKIHDWLKCRLVLLKSLSATLVPKYFIIVTMLAYQGLRYRALTLEPGSLYSQQTSSEKTSSLEHFGDGCALTTYQLFGTVNSTSLFPKPYPLDPYGPHTFSWPDSQRLPSLAAGLPHFAAHHMRCWGRDIFISLRGLFLLPGHYAAARSHIIAFGSTLRHGMIPNLLDQGNRPRYNARDATWFWMCSVRDYCRMSPEGYAFLGVSVARRFIPTRRYTSGAGFGIDPTEMDAADSDTFIDPLDPRVYKFTNTIAELCHEILERHARGIRFREWNAGADLDHAMRSDGFQIDIITPWESDCPTRGIPRGGNCWNCGTWMDKMGDSIKAGTSGVPATPRDGSPIELIGLLKSVIEWVSSEVATKGNTWWKWPGVIVQVDGANKLIAYSEWNQILLKSFERVFYVPLDSSKDTNYYIEHPELVNRRGIYKDVVSSSTAYTEYQLRPNVCIAMTHAPEMFDPNHSRKALILIKETMLGPLGIKTLDPSDWAYRGVYDNGNDSDDSAVAHGFNYHQGPEWVWVMGYFLRAYLHFFTVAEGHDASLVPMELMWVQKQLLVHKRYICDTESNPYAGLPELTNKDGARCNGSCETQSWSTGVLLEVVHDLLK
ncbi:glycogen debranching enzyme [Batrachochytrium salamandrivorans]|nr:glycogen debranching enzyme [Batrachochytrium salamandrivorans]